MYIVMQGKNWEVKEYRGEVEIDVSDDTGAIKIYTPNDEVNISMGEFEQKIKRLQLMECLQESFETGKFYIDAIEEYIMKIEADRDQLLVENGQLRRELSHGRNVLLGRYWRNGISRMVGESKRWL